MYHIYCVVLFKKFLINEIHDLSNCGIRHFDLGGDLGDYVSVFEGFTDAFPELGKSGKMFFVHLFSIFVAIKQI